MRQIRKEVWTFFSSSDSKIMTAQSVMIFCSSFTHGKSLLSGLLTNYAINGIEEWKFICFNSMKVINTIHSFNFKSFRICLLLRTYGPRRIIRCNFSYYIINFIFIWEINTCDHILRKLFQYFHYGSVLQYKIKSLIRTTG